MERSSGSRPRTTHGRLVGLLLEAGTPAGEVTGFLSSAQDALYVEAARDGEAALGPPPCPYALLVLGSGARRETTLRTDQDHALVLADALRRALATGSRRCPIGWRCPWSAVAFPAVPATSWPPTRPGVCRWGVGRSSSPAGSSGRRRMRCSGRRSSSTSGRSTATWTRKDGCGG